MQKLVFDSENHSYALDGVRIPSVTQILQRVGIIDFSFVDGGVLDAASAFGTAVHRACELHDRGKLDEESLDSNLRPYLDAWVLFRKDSGFIPQKIEEPMYSKMYRFAGTPDRIGRHDALWIVDLKSGSSLLPATEIQLAGYALLVKENQEKKEKIRRISVLLKPDGTYKMKEYRDKSRESIFIAALSVFNYLAEKGRR